LHRLAQPPLLRPLGPAHWALLLAGLAIVALSCRSYLPIDETRYVSVAWEMWLHDSFLLPLENGLPYSHKPPLLFWLIHVGWSLFGVNEWWPRLISPVFAFLSLLLVRAIAAELWPGQTGQVQAVPMVLLACAGWLLFSQGLMFDILLGFWVLLGILALVRLTRQMLWRWWLLLSVAISLGILTKGPVVLLHLLPAAVLAPWWADQSLRLRQWYPSLLLAVMAGVVISIIWAVPAGLAGGEDYREAIFHGQVLDRIAGRAPHRHPFWWYLPLLPVMLFPWTAWPALYSGLRGVLHRQPDPGVRLALSWALPALLGFSLISGKQIHYLVPEMPAFAMIIAAALFRAKRNSWNWLPAIVVVLVSVSIVGLNHFGMERFQGMSPSPWLVLGGMLVAALWLTASRVLPRQQIPLATLGMLLWLVAIHYWGIRPLGPVYDVRPVAVAIHELQAAGTLVAHTEGYHDQYQFLGRLEEPLTLVSRSGLKEWLANHPEAALILYPEPDQSLHGITPIVQHPYRSRVALLLTSKDALRWLNRQGQISTLRAGVFDGD
jgi:4-amino-4-deoxy-L-arabinose transferase-like glycosyltransferase